MNEYHVFWIKEKFAYHYFYKSTILYNFLQCYLQNKNRTDLFGQYMYITNSFPAQALITHLENYEVNGCSIHINNNHIEIIKNSQSLSLYIHEKHLLFYCNSLHDAEELLLSTLRLFNPCLFIMGKTIQNFGWISPIKKRKNIVPERY